MIWLTSDQHWGHANVLHLGKGTIATNIEYSLYNSNKIKIDEPVTGDKIDGARFKTADGTPSAGFAIAQISRPALNANG